ncbi:MAG: ice-binding family protein [Rhodococcus sp. (in: high G+C Gram-positive bacteria)]|uniref:ice-binding family protein n=1 Tax=Rhodococcus sp. TaxID=1831 RepID=UPI002ADCB06C|nr:ice-binding family protein [Rhodococcus sp. (in: high G+C Gram-positive bacteria)]
MTAPTATRRSRFFQFSGIATISVFSVGILVLPAGTAGAEATAVGLGTSEPFAVLAGAGITNTGPTTLGGDIGTYPTPTITGVSDLTITGTNHGGDAVSQGAKPDVLTAYNTLAGQGPTQPTGADLTGRTLVAGVYNSGSSIALSGTVTLDAQGDPDAVFVFQAGSTLITSSSSTVALINGTQACNVFWQVGSSATLGTNSEFRGNLLALTDITATTEATVEGRLLAINGAVTLDTNTVTIPTCAPPVTTTTPTVTTTTAVPPDTTTTTTEVPPEVTTTTTTAVPPEVTTTTTTAVPPEVTTTTVGTPVGTVTTTVGVPPIITTSRNIPSIPVIPGLPPLPGTPPAVPGTVTVPSQVPTTSASRTSAPTTQPAGPESQTGRTPQVPQVPRGSVDTGDGSTQSQSAGQSSEGWIAVLVCTFAVIAASVLVIRRTSR